MTRNVNADGECGIGIETIFQVGTVRSERLVDEFGCECVHDVAQLSVDELMQIRSVGPIRSRQIKGSAQGHVQARADDADLNADSEADEDCGRTNGNIAIVLGDDVKEWFEATKIACMIEGALEEAGIDLANQRRVGVCESDSMGGEMIEMWTRRSDTPDIARCPRVFEIDWAKYAYHFQDEWNRSHTENLTPVTNKDSDFDIVELGVQAWMAPAERTNRLVEWADEVVIPITGDYTDPVIREAHKRGVEWHAYEVQGRLPQLEDDEYDTFTPDKEEQVRGEGGLREGTAGDVEDDSDVHWRTQPNDIDEGRNDSGMNDAQADVDNSQRDIAGGGPRDRSGGTTKYLPEHREGGEEEEEESETEKTHQRIQEMIESNE